MAEEEKDELGNKIINKRPGTTDFKVLDWLAGKIAPETSEELKKQRRGKGFSKKMEESI